MKSLILSIFSIIILTFAYSNDPSGGFVQYENQEPIACKSLKFKRSGGNVYKIEYIDSKGKEVKLKGKGECEKIVRFSADGEIFELIPLDPEKPEGYKRHFLRSVDGYIDVWEYSNDMENYSNPLRPETITISFTHVKIGDNKAFKLKNKVYKKELKPLFDNCKETSIYRGFLISRVREMSEVYNENCAPNNSN